MSRPSEKQRMRDALLTTERNLSSLIGARYCHYEFRHWRNECRRALGMMPYPLDPDPDPNLLLVFEVLDTDALPTIRKADQ